MCVESMYMGVSKNRDTPKWMVKIRENPIKMDDLGGPPLFLETPTCTMYLNVSNNGIHCTYDVHAYVYIYYMIIDTRDSICVYIYIIT